MGIISETRQTTPEKEIVYVVDHKIGVRQIAIARKSINESKYKVGDTIESVAYRQGQIDMLDFFETQLSKGKI